MVAPAPAPADAFELHTALQLLAQAGRELPADAEPGSVQWMQALIDALCDLSSRDALTGLANRRQFEVTLSREVDRVARSGEPALVLMADIDVSPGSAASQLTATRAKTMRGTCFYRVFGGLLER